MGTSVLTRRIGLFLLFWDSLSKDVDSTRWKANLIRDLVHVPQLKNFLSGVSSYYVILEIFQLRDLKTQVAC
jgi:hypothetical protein